MACKIIDLSKYRRTSLNYKFEPASYIYIPLSREELNTLYNIAYEGLIVCSDIKNNSTANACVLDTEIVIKKVLCQITDYINKNMVIDKYNLRLHIYELIYLNILVEEALNKYRYDDINKYSDALLNIKKRYMAAYFDNIKIIDDFICLYSVEEKIRILSDL